MANKANAARYMVLEFFSTRLTWRTTLGRTTTYYYSSECYPQNQLHISISSHENLKSLLQKKFSHSHADGLLHLSILRTLADGLLHLSILRTLIHRTCHAVKRQLTWIARSCFFHNYNSTCKMRYASWICKLNFSAIRFITQLSSYIISFLFPWLPWTILSIVIFFYILHIK